MAQFEVSVENQAGQALQQLVEAGRNPRSALKVIGEYLVRQTDTRFRAEQSPDGTPWAPLAPGTIEDKRLARKILKILQRDGILRRSITYQVLSDEAVAVGSNLQYAAVHQFGATINREARQQTLYFRIRKGRVENRFARQEKADFAQDVQVGPSTQTVPARPFLGLNDSDRAEISQIIIDHLRRR